MSRLALITGGTQGIGAAICRLLKANGYLVAATYAHNDEEAQDFAKETSIKIFKWDVAQYAECISGVAAVEESFGKNVEVLVNNAGITRDGMLHKSEYANWADVINTDLTSCYNMSRAVINNMRDKAFGRIISISSINGLAGQLGQTNYAAAKAGIIGFTKALALESGSKGITVNAIAPGYTRTEMVEKLDKEILAAIIQRIPVKRLAEPSEIARAALFLAADDAGFITGETISVNGGQYMQ
jgi:acetoacetyl-CoA reductase